MFSLLLSAAFAALVLGTYRQGTATRNAANDARAALLNSGTIQIRTGTQPTNVSDGPTGTLLGTLTFGATAFGASSNGVATANAITSDTSADASGTAGYGSLVTSGAVIQGDCTCGQGTGDIDFDNNVIVAGGTIAISSMTLTQSI